MKELRKKYIEWAMTDKRYPLLFPLIISGVFLFVKNYFTTHSFAETLHHEFFLICSGLILLISGILFFLLKQNRDRGIAGCVIAILGLIPFIYGIYLIIPCKLTSENLVIAIVEFQSPNGIDDENLAANTRDAFWGKLEDSRKQGVPIVAKKLNKRITFKNADSDGKSAAKRIGNSKRGCAHLVLWGTVKKINGNKDDISIVPYVTVAQNMPGTEIIAAQFKELFDTNVNFHKKTSSQIVDVVKFIGGVAYYKQGDWSNAIKMFENVKLYEALIMLGISNLMAGDLFGSLEAFEKAARLQPDNIVSLNSLGMIHLQIGNYENSRMYFTRVKKIDPTNFAAINNLGIVNLKLGENKKAKENFNIALGLKNHPKVYSHLAFSLFELGQLNEAINNWETSLKKFPKWTHYPDIEYDVMDANAGLAVGEFTNGKQTQAIERYGKVIKENSDYADIAILKNDYFWPPKISSKADELMKKLNSNSQ
ncbi:MAG: tetratricopeptide repeat protein [Desulfobacula sp.]|nr:tetratricopeptide repeat protein [Desulfobacula sp.]